MAFGISKKSVFLCALLIFTASFFLSAWDIARQSIAATYSDPVQHLRAQDEALYVNSAIRITQDGDWLTPKFMGRPFFLKPPLLMWLAAISIRTFGLSLMAVRLPALLFGAAGVTAVFVWIVRCRSIPAGFLGASILAMSPLWQTFSRLCFTDILAGACAALALAAIALDPQLEKNRTAVWFGAFAGAAILAKSLAGFLPVVALVLFFVTSRTKPSATRLLTMTLACLAVAAPWHIYQLVVHPRWFWAEGIQFQLLGVGVKGMPTGDFNHSTLFYLVRLLQMDPIMVLLGLSGVCGFAFGWWNHGEKQPAQLLAFCWIASTTAALFAFQTKNLPYLVFLLPGLAILGAVCGPVPKSSMVVLTVLAVLFAVKVMGGDRPWSLHPGAPAMEGAAAMKAYYDLHRDAELISIQPDDNFYSASIPLNRVRYALLDPSETVVRTVPYYAPLGIVLTVREFLNLPGLLPTYRARLNQWGFDSIEPVGSMIIMDASSQVEDLVRQRPDSDFYLPSEWATGLRSGDASHFVVVYSPTRVFLLSRSAHPKAEVPYHPAPW
jgi:hypothetical protein